uniref:Phospholipase A2-like central domain-containing protein n=1 Tax=Sinocyclocheilus anshuiensis TaxID=1608454 RepID=A0A671MLK4_9TELE
MSTLFLFPWILLKSISVFEDTDKCCREHDHCKDTIASFSYDHGVFNTNIFTLSHCDCDNRFRRCLLGVNNTMSNLVGYGYFNVLKMRCFEFSQRMQCFHLTQLFSVAEHSHFSENKSNKGKTRP